MQQQHSYYIKNASSIDLRGVMCGADEATRVKSAAFRIVRGPLRHGTRTLRLRNQAHSFGYVILGASSNTLGDVRKGLRFRLLKINVNTFLKKSMAKL